MSNRRPTGIKAELRTQYGQLDDDQLAAEVARLRKNHADLAKKLGAAAAVLRKRQKAGQRRVGAPI